MAKYKYNNLEELINAAKLVQTRSYEYDKCRYEDYLTNDKTLFECKTHGYFDQRWSAHLNGSGCRLCSAQNNGGGKKTTEQFVKEYNEKFPDHKLDFTNSKYDGAHNKMNIGCSNGLGHLDFSMTPHDLMKGQGCRACRDERRSLAKTISLAQWKEKCKEIHNDEYNYDLITEEVRDKGDTDVPIFCKKGDHISIQNMGRHYRGFGCVKCWEENRHLVNPFNDPEVQKKILDNKVVTDHVTRSQVEIKFHRYLEHKIGRDYVRHSYPLRPYRKDNGDEEYNKQWCVDIRITNVISDLFISVDGKHWHGLKRELEYYIENHPRIYETYLKDRELDAWAQKSGVPVYRVTDEEIDDLFDNNIMSDNINNLFSVLGVNYNEHNKLKFIPIKGNVMTVSGNEVERIIDFKIEI